MAPELTEEQNKILQECEQEFADRFTDKDKEFVAHCKKPVNPPPILDDWMSRSFNNSNRGGGDGRYDYNRRNHNYYQHQQRSYQHNNYNAPQRSNRY